MPTPIFRGSVVGGKVRLDLRAQFDQYAAGLEGKRIELVLRREARRRSNQANRYLHGVVLPIGAEFCGYTVEEFKDAMKWRHLRRTDGPIETVRSTAELDSAEMALFTERVRQDMAEMGCVIPGPNEAEV